MKGNDQERWNKLLQLLDDKLQFGLLENLRGTASFQFEGNTLSIECGDDSVKEYLSRPAVLHQLELLAQDGAKVDKIVIR